MKVTQFFLGFQQAQGRGKTSGREYKFGRLYQAVPFFNWENENGRSQSSGVTACPSENAIECDDKLTQQLLAAPLPAFLEVELAPNPENLKINHVIGFRVVQAVDITADSIKSSVKSV
ncbi:hypothetical protein [Shewanella algae]|uniref:hypothetical protein n=1 Tax=Shewanella algae TaxID=38313 RepID=UPI0030056F81